MNFLADMGVSMTTVTALRQVGHNVTHLREEGLMRLEDPKIVAKARSEGRIILTFDLDFSEIRSGLAEGDSVLMVPSAGLLDAQQQMRERMNRMMGGMPGTRSSGAGGGRPGR